MYNENMGGVDQSNQMRSYYPTGRSSRKWYRYIFWFLFDVVIGNAFVLDKMSATGERRPKMGLEFRDKLAKQLIGDYVGRADVQRRESQMRALTVDTSPENAAHHSICKIESRKRECAQCKKDVRKTPSGRATETSFMCEQCSVALCKDTCFRSYHLD